jgi:hypothetical protein
VSLLTNSWTYPTPEARATGLPKPDPYHHMMSNRYSNAFHSSTVKRSQNEEYPKATVSYGHIYDGRHISVYSAFAIPATYLHKVLCIENGELVPVDQLVQTLLGVLEVMVLPNSQAILDGSGERRIVVRTLPDGCQSLCQDFAL